MALKKAAVKAVQAALPVSESPIKIRKDMPNHFQLQLHVKPGAKISRIAEMTPQFIGVQVKQDSCELVVLIHLQISASPRDGEANEEVIRFIAEVSLSVA